jgi:hypothetical protein
MDTKTPHNNCLNCNQALPDSASFCNNCGQKKHVNHLSIKVLLYEFFQSIFNLDNRLFRTLGGIFVPGKLSLAYKKGEINKYINPARLFFLSLIFHFAIYSTLFDLDDLNRFRDEAIRNVSNKELCLKFQNTLNNDTTGLFKGVAKDSLKTLVFGKSDCSKKDTFPDADINFGGDFDIKSVGIEKGDAFFMSISELEKKYTFSSLTQKYVALQYIKFARNPAGGVKFIIANLAWGVVLVILLLAWMMKVIYLRQKPYYVELVTLHMHNHVFIFLISILMIYLPNKIYGEFEAVPPVFPILSFFLVSIYVYLSMKFYFRQGWFKTFVKYIIISMIYFFLFSVFAVFVSLSSLFFF